MSHHSSPFWKGRVTLRGLTRGAEEAITSLLSTHSLSFSPHSDSIRPLLPSLFFRESRTVLEWQKLSSLQRRFVEDEDDDEEDAILILINICSSTYVCSLQFSFLPCSRRSKKSVLISFFFLSLLLAVCLHSSLFPSPPKGRESLFTRGDPPPPFPPKRLHLFKGAW